MHISRMRISDWMESEGITDDDLAARLTAAGVACDRSQISKYRRGVIRPRWRVIRLIRDLSNGAVSANDFLDLETAE